MTIGPQSFATRTPPVFDDKSLERVHVRQRLAAACRLFGQRGYAEGLLGHLTVRDPEHADRFWVNPVGIPMAQMRASDLVQVDHLGRLTQGQGLVNPVGLLLHTAVHRARPEVAAVCHAHALHASVWASLERLVDPFTQDACILFEQQALIREPRVVLDPDAATRFASAFGDLRVAFHAGHGLFTTGRTVDEAAWWFVLMERCCQTQLLAESGGRQPTRYAPEDARQIARVLGAPQFGWLSFQTLWDELILTDPALAD